MARENMEFSDQMIEKKKKPRIGFAIVSLIYGIVFVSFFFLITANSDVPFSRWNLIATLCFSSILLSGLFGIVAGLHGLL